MGDIDGEGSRARLTWRTRTFRAENFVEGPFHVRRNEIGHSDKVLSGRGANGVVPESECGHGSELGPRVGKQMGDGSPWWRKTSPNVQFHGRRHEIGHKAEVLRGSGHTLPP